MNTRTKQLHNQGVSLWVDILQLGEQLQKEGAESFNRSWEHLIDSIRAKRAQ